MNALPPHSRELITAIIATVHDRLSPAALQLAADMLLTDTYPGVWPPDAVMDSNCGEGAPHPVSAIIEICRYGSVYDPDGCWSEALARELYAAVGLTYPPAHPKP